MLVPAGIRLRQAGRILLRRGYEGQACVYLYHLYPFIHGLP